MRGEGFLIQFKTGCPRPSAHPCTVVGVSKRALQWKEATGWRWSD